MRAQAEEELLCKVTPGGNGKSVRTFTVRELEAFAKRARKAGATANTEIRVMRDAVTSDIRLVAKLPR